MKWRSILVFALVLFTACGDGGKANENNPESQEKTVALNGPVTRHCARVHYENPKTKRESEYYLIIEKQDNHLIKLEFLDGHLDTDHFTPPSFDASGKCQFKNDKGYNYAVEILGDEASCQNYFSEEKQCTARTKNGDRCKRMTTDPSGKCFQHQ